MAWPDKRMGINRDFSNSEQGSFVNMARAGVACGPYGATWLTGAMFNLDNIDHITGIPNTSVCRTGHGYGSWGLHIPPSTEDDGPYLFKWTGSCRLQIATGTWTVDTELSSGSYTIVGNGIWEATNGFIVARYSGSGSQDGSNVGVQIALTDLSAVNNYITEVVICRYEDYSRHLAGYIYREKFLENFLDKPFIRFMNTGRINHSMEIRFEHRTRPEQYAWAGVEDYIHCDTYGELLGGNAYTIANSPPNPAKNFLGSPASLKHGEVINCRILNSVARPIAKNIVTITRANPGIAETSAPHPYIDGDVVIHSWGGSFPCGMVELRDLPCTITVVDATHYNLNINTSSFTPHTGVTAVGNSSNGSATLTGFSDTSAIQVGMTVTGTGIPAGRVVNSKTATTVVISSGSGVTAGTGTTFTFDCTTMQTNQNATINRGGTGDYPVIWDNGVHPIGQFSNALMPAQGYARFTFDKYNVFNVGKQGCWVTNEDNSGGTPPRLGTPLEVMTKFMVELREMQIARGLPPSDMWYCVPHMGLLSVDPDYDLASHWAINAVDVILNGSGSWPGLPPECKLWVEYSNETWNQGSNSFSQTPYLARIGFLRYGTSTADTATYSTLRTMVMVQDLKAAYPDHPQIKYVLAGQSALQYTGANVIRISGNSQIDLDPWNTWGGDPIDHVDAWAHAPYWRTSDTLHTANAATLAAQWAAAVADEDDELVEEIFKQYFVDVIGTTASDTHSIKYYLARWDDFITPVAAAGKFVINYEGAWDRDPYSASNSAEVNSFLQAAKKSYWNAASYQWYLQQIQNKANAYFPSGYVLMERRWGHAYPHTYLNGIENARYDKAFRTVVDFNLGKTRFRRTIKVS